VSVRVRVRDWVRVRVRVSASTFLTTRTIRATLMRRSTIVSSTTHSTSSVPVARVMPLMIT